MVWNHFFISGCLKKFSNFPHFPDNTIFKLLTSGLSPPGHKGYAGGNKTNIVYLPMYGFSSFQRYPNCKTLKEEQPQCPLSVRSVASVLTIQDTLGLMKEFTLGKSHMNVNSVASVLAKHQT